MKSILLVFIGGGIGSVLRYLISKYLNNFHTIPYGTLTANILGCLLIGLILGFSTRSNFISHQHSLLLATGFCGGLTTFSTFIYENNSLLKSGDYITFGIYTIASFAIGLSAVILGLYCTK